MRTRVEFASEKFPSYETIEEGVNYDTGVYGKRLAEYFGEKLPLQGFAVTGMRVEDWGWRLDIANPEKLPLSVGCSSYGDEENPNRFLCLIEPSTPFIRKLFKRIDVRETVERLATALDRILTADPDIGAVRWWQEGEQAG
jgi:hypothetical protein